jgi:hypothetical protein
MFDGFDVPSQRWTRFLLPLLPFSRADPRLLYGGPHCALGRTVGACWVAGIGGVVEHASEVPYSWVEPVPVAGQVGEEAFGPQFGQGCVAGLGQVGRQFPLALG